MDIPSYYEFVDEIYVLTVEQPPIWAVYMPAGIVREYLHLRRMKMKNILKLGFLGIFILILFTSCPIWPEYIWFYNESSYTIFVKCDATDPSSFTLEPVNGKLMVKYKSFHASEYLDNLTVNFNGNNDLVTVSIRDSVYFRNK